MGSVANCHIWDVINFAWVLRFCWQIEKKTKCKLKNKRIWKKEGNLKETDFKKLKINLCQGIADGLTINKENGISKPSSNSNLVCCVHFIIISLQKAWTHLFFS